MKRRFIFILIILIMSSYCYGGDKDDLIKEIKAYITDVLAKEPTNNQVFLFKQKITTVDAVSSESSTEIMNAYISKDQFHYISQSSAMYQDKQDAFLILFPVKTIIRTESSMALKGNINTEILKRTKIFEYTEKILYSPSRDSNIKLLELILNKEGQDIYKIKRIQYSFNSEKKEISKIYAEFVEGFKLRSTTVIYENIDFNYKRKMNIPVKSLFMNENKLLSKYTDYRYIDNKK